MYVTQVEVRTVGVSGTIGDEKTGEGKAGTGKTKQSAMKNRLDKKRTITIQQPAGFTGSPPQQSQLPRPVFVHDNTQGQSYGWQQEGTHSKGQVQHLILVFADGPAVHFQVLFFCTFGCRGGCVGEVEAGAVFWLEIRADRILCTFFPSISILQHKTNKAKVLMTQFSRHF